MFRLKCLDSLDSSMWRFKWWNSAHLGGWNWKVCQDLGAWGICKSCLLESFAWTPHIGSLHVSDLLEYMIIVNHIGWILNHYHINVAGEKMYIFWILDLATQKNKRVLKSFCMLKLHQPLMTLVSFIWTLCNLCELLLIMLPNSSYFS